MIVLRKEYCIVSCFLAYPKEQRDGEYCASKDTHFSVCVYPGGFLL